MAEWERSPPRIYNVVTGFFPETSPKETWATDPRPLLICGTGQNPDTGMYLCRVAYGTSVKLDRSHSNDLVVSNLSLLNLLCLKKPTRFVISSGKHMVILPWTEEYFRPWTGNRSPVLSRLPDDMQHYVGYILGKLTNLPQF